MASPQEQKIELISKAHIEAQWKKEFEASLSNPEFIKFAKEKAIEMLTIIDLFDEHIFTIPKEIKERLLKAKAEGIGEFEIATENTRGVDRLSRLDFGMSFIFKSIDEIAKFDAKPLPMEVQNFCFDLFCTYKAIEFINIAGKSPIKNIMDKVLKNLVITRGGFLDTFVGKTFEKINTGDQYYVIGMDRLDTEDYFKDIQFRVIELAHELTHHVLPNIITDGNYPLERIQNPPLTYSDSMKYPYNKPHLLSVGNVLDEAIPIIAEEEVMELFENSQELKESMQTVRFVRSASEESVHKLATILSHKLREKGLTLEVVPTFLGKLKELIEDKKIFTIYKDWEPKKYEELMNLILDSLKINK